MMTTRISVDYENNAEAWWIAACSDEHAPETFAPMLADNTDTIVDSDTQAEEILTWAENLPGWNDGPVYAPCALTFRDA